MWSVDNLIAMKILVSSSALYDTHIRYHQKMPCKIYEQDTHVLWYICR